jgi:hypothetical protein
MLLSTHFTRLNPPYNNFSHALPDLDWITTALPCFQLTLSDLTHLTTTLTYFSHALPNLGFGIDNNAFFSYIHDPYFEIKYEFGVIR